MKCKADTESHRQGERGKRGRHVRCAQEKKDPAVARNQALVELVGRARGWEPNQM